MAGSDCDRAVRWTWLPSWEFSKRSVTDSTETEGER